MELKKCLLTFVILISYGMGVQSVEIYQLNQDESNDLINMIDTSSPEISKGYHEAKRLPEEDISSEPGDIHFYLYNNPDNASEYQEVFYNWHVESHKLKVIPSAPWKILIHGFLNDRDSIPFPKLIVQEYLKRWKRTGKPYNILVVDWGKLAYSVERTWRFIPIYTKAVRNVEIAGQRVGDMIEWLFRNPINDNPTLDLDNRENYAISDLSKVHIIGFSLGAHVAGKAGQAVINRFSRRIGRISGLDPAGPEFYNGIADPGRKLKRNDANCMDIIHTSWNSFGIGEEIGDADFYPNAGYFPLQAQPWCLNIKHFLAPFTCSHNLAPVYFAFSINHPTATEACECGSWFSYQYFCPCKNKATMGEDWNENDIGRYYLSVTSKELDDHLKKMTRVESNSTLALRASRIRTNRIRD